MFNQIKKVIGILLIAGIGGVAGAYIYSNNYQITSPISKKNATVKPVAKFASMPNMLNEVVDFTKAADATVHGVVHVKTFMSRNVYNPFYNPFQNFFGNPQQQQQKQQSEGMGSGVILTEDGYIVTNNHVIANADKVEVTLNDNKTYTAKVVGTDPSTDLALLKINEKGLPFISYGNSDDLKVGEWVLAVGNPFELNSTVTAGIVSAKGRNIGMMDDPSKIESYIQTDAAVNPGNSGGALVNTRGELVGINSAIASNTGSYTGYSFAVPVNIVRKVMDDLVEFGKVQRGFIGVSIRNVDSKLADEKGLKEAKGIYVDGLSEGGAAKVAGLQQGDIIIKVGDINVNTVPELQEQIGRYHPGDKINVTALRDGNEKIFSVVLRNKEGGTSITKPEPQAASLNLLGGTFREVSKDERDRLGIGGGVKITGIATGKLRNAGIKEGFVITSIDKKPIRTTEDLEDALRNRQGGILIEGVYPNGARGYYGFGM